MALIFNLHQLIDMMSIGTLLAYTIVAICVLVLRYEDNDMTQYNVNIKIPVIIKQLFNLNFIKYPNNLTSYITKFAIVIYSILSIIFCIILTVIEHKFGGIFLIIIFSIIIAGMLLILLIIWRQPVSTISLTFKVPLVPLIPCISILINLYLMFQLDAFTWMRFLIWIGIGYVIYFSYGIKNSVQGNNDVKLKENNVKMSNIEKVNNNNNNYDNHKM